jgi:hypothetical protein
MTKRVTSQTRAGSSYQFSTFLRCATAFFAASILVGCSSSSDTVKDSSADQAKDTANSPIDATSDVVIDSAKDVATDSVIDVATDSEDKDLAITDVPDTRPPVDVTPSDAPVICSWNGQTYTPGETILLGDGCGGTCVCSSTGTRIGCTAACPVDSGADIKKDTNKLDQQELDGAYDATPPIDTACVTGAACSLASGTKGFCAAGVCTACSGATDDTKCKTAYGTGTICLANACSTGDCHDNSTDCSAGRICGSSVPHACGDCTTDTQCTQDARYGTGYLCVNNLCVHGDCHDTSADCTGTTKVGQVCGATTAHTCGACTSDTQCTNDTTYATTKPICETTTGLTKTGQCVANPTTGTGKLCTSNNVECPVNSADFCCGNKCVAGNCCDDTDCSSLGANFNCLQNTCTQCNSVVGNSYFVDPVNGDDTGATGSGMSGTAATPGCSFRTLTKALEVINASGTAPTGTTITIVGRTTGTTSLYTVAAGGVTAETLPIVVPANVTITTKTGPVKLTLGSTKTGFSLVGNDAGIQPISDALLTIDGASVSGPGIVVTTAANANTVNLKNIIVKDTNDDGIQITKGTANIVSDLSVTGAAANGINISGTGAATIGPGVSVTTAGANGLNISSGSATITVTSSQTSTAFDSNGQYGISVSGTGVLTINGATPTTGTAIRTVSAKNNTGNNVNFASSSATTSTIDHFYSYNSEADGLHIVAGSHIQVRSSVFKSNAHNGINITSSTTDSDLTDIDLGTTADPGVNTLQSATGSGPNLYAGLCVNLTEGTTTQTLQAAANLFAGKDCSATASGLTITKSATCSGATNIGVAAGTITFVATNCTVL